MNDEKENIEYGEGEDDDAMVDDMEDMMKNIRILLFLTVFAALGIIFYCNKEDIDNAKLLALMVVTISIVPCFIGPGLRVIFTPSLARSSQAL